MAVHCQPLVNSNAFIHEAECIADVQNAVKELTRGLMKNDETCLIGYKMVNKDLSEAKRVFVRIFEGLY